MPNCPGAKLSGAKLSWCQIVLVPNCPLLLSWCQIVRFYYLGAKLSPLLSWCQIVQCQIVRCQIVLSPCGCRKVFVGLQKNTDDSTPPLPRPQFLTCHQNDAPHSLRQIGTSNLLSKSLVHFPQLYHFLLLLPHLKLSPTAGCRS